MLPRSPNRLASGFAFALAFAFAFAFPAVDLSAAADKDPSPAPITPAPSPAKPAAVAAADRGPPKSTAPLLQALRERRVLRFHYHGHDRVVEPHACGLSTNGEAILHGYQSDGGSVSGTLPGWRTFTVDQIQHLKLTETRFSGPRPDYAADRPRLDPLWGELVPREPAAPRPEPATAVSAAAPSAGR